MKWACESCGKDRIACDCPLGVNPTMPLPDMPRIPSPPEPIDYGSWNRIRRISQVGWYS